MVPREEIFEVFKSKWEWKRQKKKYEKIALSAIQELNNATLYCRFPLKNIIKVKYNEDDIFLKERV